MPLRLVKRIAHRTYRRMLAGGVVLLYHRIADLERDPQLLSVAPDLFEQHLEVANRVAAPMTLEDFVESARRGSLPRRALAVTFDDGYADNLLHAAPVLEKRHVPATVFVASGHVEQGTEFWWDELERLVLMPTELPPCFDETLAGQRLRIEFSSAERSTPCDASWDVLRKPVTSRQRLYGALHAICLDLDVPAREELLGGLSNWCGVPRTTRASHRPMTRDEVRQLDASAAVAVGGHTAFHPRLSKISQERQREEVFASADWLKCALGPGSRAFAYPYGGAQDFGDIAVHAAREAGFRLACANVPGTVRSAPDSFRLPRRLVRNWSAVEFEQHLLRWFAD
jgi:peptidoglycan/xylan/chitin deacetylase (PgdA/CDA1 family)